jgi:Carbohydrate family 9 binding domain-like
VGVAKAKAWRAVGLAGALACASAANAKPPARPASEAGRPTVRAMRIEVSQAPAIDGDLSDPIWAEAAVIEGLKQADPDQGQPATERVVLRILYDANNLYFGVYAYDDPKLIISRTRERDGNLNAGDAIRIFLDPERTRRDGFAFEVNPSGARLDALIQNNTDYLTAWNTIWTARTKIVSDGWTAEIAIPFHSLSYDPSQADWGFDFTRVIRRRAERARWTSDVASIPNQDISQSGTLTGIHDTNVGIGLDVQTYARLSVKRDFKPTTHDSLSGAFSGNAYYKIAQALTGTLTLNPDFSNSPLDERQVNTTRFSLFYPETRDFFLQDAFSFEFGGLGFGSSTPNAQPFFSRNMGLVNGVPVTILGGAKLSGSYDTIGIGAISVRTNESHGIPGQTLSVVRATAPVLDSSKVGFIFTNGDPTGLTRNTLAGGDFQYRDLHVLGDNILESDSYYERSFSSAVRSDSTFGTYLNYPNEPWGGYASFKQVGRNFDPALGFINRPGIRDYELEISERNRYRDQYLRSLQFRLDNFLVTDLHNHLQSRQTHFWITVQNRFVDVIEMHFYNYFENVPATFLLPGSIPVPPGQYEWTNFAPRIDTTNGRAIVFTWQLECCHFYNGDYLNSDLAITVRYRDLLEFAPHYLTTWIDLPTGKVTIHVLQGVTTINFTPDMSLILQGQYDNISHNFGFAARYRWEYEPGQEIFAGFGQSATIPGLHDFQPQTTQFSFRLGHTFRF